ncbi:Uncharacterised protein [Legionella beliardensis]|uniref:Secreted protein n=1 Tax=Legionella beliardensis TaxID=91822 RepID=A0A378I471_9GAMM|nr:hypothetical protein [Legionella beliardensis]STX29491.1 Uncharacterised protein [Legionella beliardensis]
MNHLRQLSLVVTVWFPLVAYAADEPDIVEGTEEFNMQMCVQNNKNECVNSHCLTSTDTECIPNCEDAAEDKCKEKALEQ